MTREEAIEEINKVFEPAFANYIITALTDGATTSDKALEQEPCEDCVSRQAVLDAIKDERTKSHYANTWIDGALDIRARVVSLPSVTSAREHGRWIFTNEKDELYAEICICDKCNYAQIGVGDFCSNCGADMRGEFDDK